MSDAPTPPERFSASFLQAVSECHFSAHYGREAGAGEAAARGTLFHSAASAVAFVARLGKERTISGGRARTIAAGHFSQGSDAAESGAVSLDVIAETLDLVEAWADSEVFEVESEVFTPEAFFEREIAGRWISSRLDLVEIDDLAGGTARVTDYKTSPHVPRSEEIAARVPPSVYAWQIFRRYPTLREVVYRESYVRWNAVREVAFSIEDADGIEEKLGVLVGQIEATYKHVSEDSPLPARVSSRCSFCPVSERCPIEAKPEAIDSLAEAEDLLAGIVVSERRLKDAKAALKGYLSEQGLVEIVSGGMVGGFDLSTSHRFDKKAAKEAGLDLEPFEKEVESSRFTIRKAKA